MVWKINMEVYTGLKFDNSTLFNCLGNGFSMGYLSFYAIPLLFYDVMIDITIIP